MRLHDVVKAFSLVVGTAASSSNTEPTIAIDNINRHTVVNNSVAFFVSSASGSDTNPGTSPTSAFATVQRAQQAVRDVIPTATSDIVVQIAPGRYYAPHGMVFNSSDCFPPTSTLQVTYQGLSHSDPLDRDQQAVIYGGFAIPSGSWQQVPSNSTTYSGYGSGSGWNDSHNAKVWFANVTAELLALFPPSSSPSPSPSPSPTPKQCGALQHDQAIQGFDLPGTPILSGSLANCCSACANRTDCFAVSFCGPDHPSCGSPTHPVDCYMKSKGGSPAPLPHWTTADPGGPPAPPTPKKLHRFFNLVENDEGSVLARVPKKGSGYMKGLNCTNTNTEVVCDVGVFAQGGDALKQDQPDLSVFANLGADWFSETRVVQSVDVQDSTVTVTFDSGSGQFQANDKVYLQGGQSLIGEDGEWALESSTGLVYLQPRDAEAMAAGKAAVVAATTKRVLDIRGEDFSSPSGRVSGLNFDFLTLIGSDFGAEYKVMAPSDPGTCVFEVTVTSVLGRIAHLCVFFFLSQTAVLSPRCVFESDVCW